MSIRFGALGALCALTLSVSAHAQEPPTPAAPAPAAPAPAAPAQTPTPPAQDAPPAAAGKVDAEARKALDGIVAAHKALTSFSADCTFTATQGTQTQNAKSTLAYALPNKISVKSTLGGDTGVQRTVISDGTSVFTTISAQKDKYTKADADKTSVTIARALAQGGVGTGLLALLVADPKAVDKVLPPTLTSLTFGPDETVGGTESRTVVGLGSSPGSPPLQFTFVFGKADNLLRRITISGRGDQQFSLSEEYTNVQANPTLPAETFKFTPPAGATLAETPVEAPAYDPRLKVGAKPLPFSGTDTAGKPISLAAYKGKVVLVDFWATWCGPCVGEVPNVVRVYNKYKAKGFNVIGVSLDRENDKNRLLAFTKENAMPWPQIYDGKFWEAALAKAYGVQSIPFTLLIGRDGKIAAVGARGEELEPAVLAALAK